MKGSVIALDQLDGQPVAARLENGRLEDLLLDRADALPGPGAIFRATVGRPLKGQGAVIVQLADGLTGFLREAAGLRPGASALVQVTGYAEPGKALPVSLRLLFKSRFAIVTPQAAGLNLSRQLTDPARRATLRTLAEAAMAGSAMGLILRSNAETGEDTTIAADIARMRGLAEAILADADGPPQLLLDGPSAHEAAFRDWPAPDLLDEAEGSLARHGVLELLEPLRGPQVALSGGASAFIEPTRALVAVDVNTGTDTSPAAGLKANLALARELPRQLRLRGLGGQITLDLAPMPKRERAAFEGHLRAAFRADPIETALLGWTPLGHYELQRKRERLPLRL